MKPISKNSGRSFYLLTRSQADKLITAVDAYIETLRVIHREAKTNEDEMYFLTEIHSFECLASDLRWYRDKREFYK